MKYLGMVAWLVTALASVAVGLLALGYRVLDMGWLADNPTAVTLILYVVGICGVLSLVMFFTSVGKGSCACCHPHTTHNPKL